MTRHLQPDSPGSPATLSGNLFVPFHLYTNPSAHGPVPVHGGLCLPKGLTVQAEDARVFVKDWSTRAQTRVLSRWSDGSIRWLTASWTAEPGLADEECQLQIDSRQLPLDSVSQKSRITLRRFGNRFCIQQSDPSPNRVQHTEFDITPCLLGSDSTTLELEFGDLQTEISGPVRSVFAVEARVSAVPGVTLLLRFEVWPESGHVRLQHRLRNSRRARHSGGLWDLGDSGSFLFSGLEFKSVLHTCNPTVVRWKTQPTTDARMQFAESRLTITQFGSGGPAWASSIHMSADGRSSVTRRGYEAVFESGTTRGYQAAPVLALLADDCSLSVTVPEFREKFPTSISVESGVLTIGAFPAIPGTDYELQGGEQSTQEIWFCTSAVDERLRHSMHDANMLQPADWIREAGVFDWFPGELSDSSKPTCSDRYQNWLTEASTGTRNIESRRNTIDEFGWRHFGEVPADHEQTHYAGKNTIVSHYNNQFDLLYGAILNGIASGDNRWRHVFAPLARHVMDIDIYHTAEDRQNFNGGLFWHTDHEVDARSATHRTYSRHNTQDGSDYGGGPGSEHNYTTGLLTYYYLTGDPEAAASVQSLADWVIAMDDGRGTVFALLDDGPTGSATATVTADYHGPGRASGNSINALLDAWELTTHDKYLQKAEDLIQRVAHPEQDLNALDLLDAEFRWSYTVALTAMGRYLNKMSDAGRQGTMYDYVRRTLQHYGNWMLEHERPTLSQPDRLAHVTEAWAAQEFRKANVLRIAASCCDHRTRSNRMRDKANDLNDAAWHDLYEFGDKHLTARCWSIIMTEGLRDVFHRRHRNYEMPPATDKCETGPWSMFVPQTTRVRQKLKSPPKLLSLIPRLLDPSRWAQTFDALRRRM